MSIDITYLHIKRAIASNEECFLCTLEDEIERKYIDTYLSELVMNTSSRQKIIESRGFCNHHFYKMLIKASKPESSDGHGMALIMKSVTEKLIQDLHKQKSCHRDNFLKMLANETMCPACIHLSDFMGMYAKKAMELLSSNHEEFSKLFKESKGLCIPHFVTLLHVAKENVRDLSQGIIETITEVEEKNLSRLNSELAEYIRRQSYEFSDKDRAAVEDIVLRSVEKIAGRRGVKLRNLSERRMR
jgi:hypothetical protein